MDGGRRIVALSGGSQAQHERNVLLPTNHGGFDEVSGVAGVDVDQDRRSFASRLRHDGDADIALMAPRRHRSCGCSKRFCDGHAAVAIRLTGTKSNRDAIGAQVTVETDRGRFAPTSSRQGSDSCRSIRRRCWSGWARATGSPASRSCGQVDSRRRQPTFQSTIVFRSWKGMPRFAPNPSRRRAFRQQLEAVHGQLARRRILAREPGSTSLFPLRI